MSTDGEEVVRDFIEHVVNLARVEMYDCGSPIISKENQEIMDQLIRMGAMSTVICIDSYVKRHSQMADTWFGLAMTAAYQQMLKEKSLG